MDLTPEFSRVAAGSVLSPQVTAVVKKAIAAERETIEDWGGKKFLSPVGDYDHIADVVFSKGTNSDRERWVNAADSFGVEADRMNGHLTGDDFEDHQALQFLKYFLTGQT